MNKIDYFMAIDEHPFADVARHVSTRLHPRTMQVFFTNHHEFDGWMRNAAFSYRDYDEFMAGFTVLCVQGWFAGVEMGIGEMLMFSAHIPPSQNNNTPAI